MLTVGGGFGERVNRQGRVIRTPEQDTAHRLRRVGTAMRNQAKTLQRRAQELHGLARELRKKTEPEAAGAILRTMLESGRLAALETEVGL